MSRNRPQVACVVRGFEGFISTREGTHGGASPSQTPGEGGTHVGLTGSNPHTAAGRSCVPTGQNVVHISGWSQ